MTTQELRRRRVRIGVAVATIAGGVLIAAAPNLGPGGTPPPHADDNAHEHANGGRGTDPAYTVDTDVLAAALTCSDLTDDAGTDHEPVLLVHGTFTHGAEQYDWSWVPMLDERGFDWCHVTYPDRGMVDLQTSAEYVAFAVNHLASATGGKVDMVGHSQGGLMPRWAIRWWPSVQRNLDDFVLLASPNHGTDVAAGPGFDNPFGMPEAFWQMATGSNFVTALNADDETPGDVDYTSIWTVFDELVQPSYGDAPTAALELGQENPSRTNLAIQDLCVARPVDHVTIGLTDRAVMELTMQAFVQPGPLDLDAVDPTVCDLPIQFPDEAGLGPAIEILLSDLAGGAPQWHLAREEPPLRDYATS